jgi:hypothetical protein
VENNLLQKQIIHRKPVYSVKETKESINFSGFQTYNAGGI